MRPLPFAVLLLVAASAPGLSSAQQADALHAGERVRVLSRRHSGEFTLLDSDGHTLLFQDTSGSTSFSLPVDSIWRLQVRRPRPSLQAGARGAGIGFLAGFISVAVVVKIMGKDEDPYAAGAAAIVLVPGVSIVGFLLGVGHPGHHWQTFRGPTGISLRPAGRSRFMISFSYRMQAWQSRDRGRPLSTGG